MKTAPDNTKVQQVLKQIISLSDPDTLSQALKEIERGKILRAWRLMPGAKRSWRHKSISCRDGLMHKEVIKIVHYFDQPNSQPEYYTYCFGCRAKSLYGLFRKFIENNQQQVLSFPGLQYKAGQKLDGYNNLHFDSAQATQDFCDLILTSECYQVI